MVMHNRLGDTIDDFCVKCKRLTNHHIVSMMEEDPAKVRCCSCYHDHDYRFEQPEPKKLTKKQLEEENAKTAGRTSDGEDGDAAEDEDEDIEEEEDEFVDVLDDDSSSDD